MVAEDSEEGQMPELYNMDRDKKNPIFGYLQALKSMELEVLLEER